ncbi:Protein phnM [Fibrisoma limi BUZ 3]|uniref:Protein phnM n=1 Tax=Fibrisoma limi BUZ 3 TaxID=1185876 RepID=I2GCE9_9BACT|nr:alpha-D-ribose 1-methylphosphonate 5-triphosphate diphosphatase [Fibrisoma limi]CCH51573.1 Protein phnM [Fibrisoma limi BUZ 3]
MNHHILTNAHIITSSDDFTGSVVIENGLITDIVRGKTYAEGDNLQGMWLAPGCIDIHSDYLEREIHPRPGADFPIPMAFHFMDQRAAACGLTTVLSAVSFSDNDGLNRSFSQAIGQSREIDELRKGALVRHFVHARLNPNTDTVLDYLDQMKSIESLKLVVYNDAIPGQRQFTFEDLVVKRMKVWNTNDAETRQRLHQQIDELSRINHRDAIQAAFEGVCPLGSHDDTTVAHVEEARHFGATLSEMPTTLIAARKAKELGMLVCMGAPNYVRGGSHCGNLSCVSAMQEDLVDMICSDYHFPTMLTAVLMMMHDGMSPSQAINLVSLNPAKAIGLDKIVGSIDVGKEADLIAFYSKGTYADVKKVWVRGVAKFQVAAQEVTNSMGVNVALS